MLHLRYLFHTKPYCLLAVVFAVCAPYCDQLSAEAEITGFAVGPEADAQFSFLPTLHDAYEFLKNSPRAF